MKKTFAEWHDIIFNETDSVKKAELLKQFANSK